MPEEPAAPPRPKVLDLLAWAGVILIWAIFLLAMAIWSLVGWFRGYAGRRRLRRLAFLLPLLAASTLAWKLEPILWARFVLLDKAAFAAQRSEGVEAPQVEASLRTEALRLGFTQEVRLLRWTWAVPIRGAVDESILPKPADPWSEENLVR